MLSNREFSVANEHAYDRSSPVRWIAAHIVRYPLLPIIFVLTAIAMAGMQSLAAVLVGRAFDTAVGGAGRQALALAAGSVALAYLAYSASDIVNTIAAACCRSASSAIRATKCISACLVNRRPFMVASASAS